jgi:hypothetical protein
MFWPTSQSHATDEEKIYTSKNIELNTMRPSMANLMVIATCVEPPHASECRVLGTSKSRSYLRAGLTVPQLT